MAVLGSSPEVWGFGGEPLFQRLWVPGPGPHPLQIGGLVRLDTPGGVGAVSSQSRQGGAVRGVFSGACNFSCTVHHPVPDLPASRAGLVRDPGFRGGCPRPPPRSGESGAAIRAPVNFWPAGEVGGRPNRSQFQVLRRLVEALVAGLGIRGRPRVHGELAIGEFGTPPENSVKYGRGDAIN